MLLQKSSTYSGKHRKAALDFVASYIWRHSDFVVGAGVGAGVGVSGRETNSRLSPALICSSVWFLFKLSRLICFMSAVCLIRFVSSCGVAVARCV